MIEAADKKTAVMLSNNAVLKSLYHHSLCIRSMDYAATGIV